MARALVQASMPHKNTKENCFKRKNGNYSLVMLAHPDIGLPYGSIPRLEMIWITSEAVKRKTREIVLGNSLNSFMSELGIPRTGPYIERFKDQTKRLFSCAISCTYDDGKTWQIENVKTVKRASLTWAPEQRDGLKKNNESMLLLDQEFFNEIINRPVPIDLNVIKRLKNSSLALDIYAWMTYRMSYLNKRTCIPWEALHNQFGSNYADDKSGRYAFKKNFTDQMLKVLALYPEAKVQKETIGLVLYPSKTHISKKNSSLNLGHADLSLKVSLKPEINKENNQDKVDISKINTLIDIIKNDLKTDEKLMLLKEFDVYLSRNNLEHMCFFLRQDIELFNVPLKQHLFEFINKYWHHLLLLVSTAQDVSP
jgi:hypothetical protein